MPRHSTIDGRPQSPPRRQRACQPCTKAKARCHYENNEIGDGCNRCQRLQIPCHPKTTKSLRKPRQVRSKDGSEPVNVSTAPVQGRQEIPSAGQGHVMVDSISPQSQGGANGAPNPAVPRQEQPDIPYHPKLLPPRPSASNHLLSSPGFGIPWDQAEKAVENFAIIFTAHLPFIILDHDITARRLSTEKPLLFRAILMIAVELTSAKSREIRRSIDAWIGQHLLVMEEQDIGALQGLIVYIFWANPHFCSDHRATQLIYFALGLAHSLGITRESTPKNNQPKKESEVNEEHRAFLACYYLVSFNSFQFGRPNPLSTSYVQYCVDSLERSSEFATDFLLIKLVKFRQFIGRIPTVYQGICDTKWCREVSEDASMELREITRDLDALMSDVSHKHPKLLLLWTLHNSAIVQLNLPMTYVIPDSEAASRLQLECLQHCLQASRAFVDRVKSFSPDGFLHAPFTTFTDLVSMLIATSRLILVNVEGWDLEKARQTIDLKTIINEILAKVALANQVKAAKVAEAAVASPSSYKPDGPGDEKQNRMHVFVTLVESIRDWLDSQGAFLSDREKPGHREDTSLHATRSAPIHTSPQSPQWNFTYFFESIIHSNGDSSS
ncbi:hypothetical protein F5Y01DRAFT_270765 [Xylaria sp. FL0043]|nr:hypothetical protein F5Y01DRAFT_270765 [Xylaria sp. FL0043]